MANSHNSPIHAFMAKMQVAVEMDAHSNMAGEPAIEKLIMLPKLWTVLHNCNTRVQLEFIRVGGLGSLRNWLEPLPDGSLPYEQVRNMVLQLLVDLPIDVENDAMMCKLKASGLGKAVMFFASLPEESHANKTLARGLVEKWSRAIFKVSDNFVDVMGPDAKRPRSSRKPTPMQPEPSDIHESLNEKLKRMKKKHKFHSIAYRHSQMKTTKIKRGLASLTD